MGNAVEVLCDAKDPANARVNMFIELWRGSLALGTFGLLCLSVGIGTWFYTEAKRMKEKKYQVYHMVIHMLLKIVSRSGFRVFSSGASGFLVKRGSFPLLFSSLASLALASSMALLM